MTLNEIISHCNESIGDCDYIIFTDDQLRLMTAKQAQVLKATFGDRYLMQLPKNEIKFFEWLKIADEPVWNDLWKESTDPPYTVSLAFLQDLCGANFGGAFLICELRNTDNYYFAPSMFIDKESSDFMAAVKDRFVSRQKLSPAQALALEASIAPIDIWHFAYKYGFHIGAAKNAVRELVEDRILLHVTDADHLTQYFDVH
ncbi:MAG: hypothetical protein HYX66_06485 [Ignavibacteria bacterium]|nr:hypothetical protein [Ignavibacteria bacterium]